MGYNSEKRAMAHKKKAKLWFTDKQMLALVTGCISTLLTLVNLYVGTF